MRLITIAALIFGMTGIAFADFNDNGNGTVTDTETGLVWQQEAVAPLTWQAALAHCETLILADQDDWRLPTIRELNSISDLEVYSPAINTNFFPDTQSSDYWTSTTSEGSTAYAWIMDFQYGDNGILSKTSTAHVRAVRGGIISPPPPSAYINNGDGTVSDTKTGLVWQKATANDESGTLIKMTWQEALSHCETLTLAGQDDWRLPTIRELNSLARSFSIQPRCQYPFFP